LDNLIYRREIPTMIAVFINPGRTPEQPEPTPSDWGDRSTNRPTEYNSLDDKYARVIVDELMPALAKDYNISTDPDRHLHRRVAAARPLPQGPQHRRQLRQPARRRRLRGHRPVEREEADSNLSAGRTQRQSRRRTRRRPVRSAARLVLPERAADAGAHRQGLRRQLHVGHEHARAAHGRTDSARDDAMAVARSRRLDRRQRHDRAIVQRAEAEVGRRGTDRIIEWLWNLEVSDTRSGSAALSSRSRRPPTPPACGDLSASRR